MELAADLMRRFFSVSEPIFSSENMVVLAKSSMLLVVKSQS